MDETSAVLSTNSAFYAAFTAKVQQYDACGVAFSSFPPQHEQHQHQQVARVSPLI